MTNTEAKTHTTTYETSPWSRDTHDAEARKLTLQVTQDHVDRARWIRFNDPVCQAVNDALGENACTELIWNSDGFHPRCHDDDARIGIHVEITDPATGRTTEYSYWQPLPRRAERALKKLYNRDARGFQPFTMRIAVPAAALPTPAANPPQAADSGQAAAA